MMFLSFIIVTPHWYLNQGPLVLQSNTLPLCHQGQGYIEGNFTLIIYLGPEKNDNSFAISHTAYLLVNN